MKKIDYEKIGAKIKCFRKKKKLTQQQLANLIYKTESSIRKYEKGLIEIPTSVLKSISDVLDVTVLELLDVDKEMAADEINAIACNMKIPPWEMLGLSRDQFLENMQLPEKNFEYQHVFGKDLLEKYTGIAIGLKARDKVYSEIESELKIQLLELFDQLNLSGKQKSVENIDLLTKIPEFKKTSN